MSSSAPARPLRNLVLAFVLLGTLLAAVPAHAGTTTVEVSTSAPLVGFGESATLTITLGGQATCLQGRTVMLEWRPADSAGFATVGSGTSSAEGIVTSEQTQPHTGRYRASVLSSGGCPAATSEATLVRVRASVDASVVTGSGVAGSCVDVAASVRPARPGQLVDLQRRLEGAWATIEHLTLDALSNAAAAPCFGFQDVGRVRLRVRWVAQDHLNETDASPALAFRIDPAPWMEAIKDAIGTRSISMAVGEEDAYLYLQDAGEQRIPASNTKLLLSMAMLDTFGPDLRIRTGAAVTSIDDAGVVEDLWIVGRGDPNVSRATIGALALELAHTGVTRVRGRVMGSTGYFKRDWDAPGWNAFARDYVNRPTALTFEGNEGADPERRAAAIFDRRLEDLGIVVTGTPGSGPPPSRLDTLAFVMSKPLQTLLRNLLRPSDNFAAEVLGKRLGVEAAGTPGTIAKGAAAIEDFAHAHGVDVTINDNSGLSYANRVTAEGIVRLLWAAEDATWHEALRGALPTGGQGTLRDRLHGVPVRAKTGTLTDVSALSGWVRSSGTDTWVEFSILCTGMSKTTASAIADEIVTILAEQLA
jgi:D-alanyl-D-alanine carboxypeptidase/D-alanyl-D-alanine-endopeptidase (penicillin-binding protein 4)